MITCGTCCAHLRQCNMLTYVHFWVKCRSIRSWGSKLFCGNDSALSPSLPPIRTSWRRSNWPSTFSEHRSFPLWAAAPKDRCPVGHRGEFSDVGLSLYPPPTLFKSLFGLVKPWISPPRPFQTLQLIKSPLKTLNWLSECPLRTSGSSHICSKGHWPFGATVEPRL